MVVFLPSAYRSCGQAYIYTQSQWTLGPGCNKRFSSPFLKHLKMYNLLCLFLASSALGAVYHNEQVCDGPYVLCSAAHCTYLPGNSSFASCSCVGPYDGLNLGLSNNTCKSRTESLISTFSLRNPYAPPSQYETVSSGGWSRNGWGGFGGPGGSQGSVPPVYAIPCTGSNAAPWTDW